MKTILLLLLSLFLICCEGQNETPTETIDSPHNKAELYKAEYNKVRESFTSLYPEIESMTELELATFVMGKVYERVRNMRDTPYDYNKPFYDIYKEGFLDQSESFACGGISQIFIIITKSLGLKVRYVSLYNFDQDILYSHATSEVFINGKWLTFDATFNQRIKNSEGDLIGYFEAAQEPFTVDQLETIEGKAGSYEFIELGELLAYIYAPATIYSDHQYYPESWDATLLDGSNRNMFQYPGTLYYEMLNTVSM